MISRAADTIGKAVAGASTEIVAIGTDLIAAGTTNGASTMVTTSMIWPSIPTFSARTLTRPRIQRKKTMGTSFGMASSGCLVSARSRISILRRSK